jgi:hypothetical protein
VEFRFPPKIIDGTHRRLKLRLHATKVDGL